MCAMFKKYGMIKTFVEWLVDVADGVTRMT